jgi:hypothetical protein
VAVAGAGAGAVALAVAVSVAVAVAVAVAVWGGSETWLDLASPSLAYSLALRRGLTAAAALGETGNEKAAEHEARRTLETVEKALTPQGQGGASLPGVVHWSIRQLLFTLFDYRRPVCSLPPHRPVCSLPPHRPVCSLPPHRPVCSLTPHRPVCSLHPHRPVCSLPLHRPVCGLPAQAAAALGRCRSLRTSQRPFRASTHAQGQRHPSLWLCVLPGSPLTADWLAAHTACPQGKDEAKSTAQRAVAMLQVCAALGILAVNG